MQGVCNEKRAFIDVYAGEPGSIHDSRLFEKSDLSANIDNGNYAFPNNCHLVGDLAYKLKTTLMVGFKDIGNLTNQQITFNNKLSRGRIIIENAFALLKGRFRRLKYMETTRLDLVSILIITATILHNVCVLNNDLPDNIDIEHEMDEERQGNPEPQYVGGEEGNAQEKRLHIMYNLGM